MSFLFLLWNGFYFSWPVIASNGMQMNETNSGASCPERNCALAPHLWPRHRSLAEVLKRRWTKKFRWACDKTRNNCGVNENGDNLNIVRLKLWRENIKNKQTGCVVAAKMLAPVARKWLTWWTRRLTITDVNVIWVTRYWVKLQTESVRMSISPKTFHRSRFSLTKIRKSTRSADVLLCGSKFRWNIWWMRRLTGLLHPLTDERQNIEKKTGRELQPVGKLLVSSVALVEFPSWVDLLVSRVSPKQRCAVGCSLNWEVVHHL